MHTITKKTVKAGKLVDTKHVDTVIKNYKRERWVHNSKRLGKEDSLSIWYSLDELQKFIELSKSHGADGIKVYFGAYDQDHVEEPYAGRQTVVFVATKQKETPDGEANKDVYINTEKGNSILAFNAGKPCPPYCIIVDGGIEDVGITIVDKGEDGIVIA